MSYHPGDLIADLDQALGEGAASRRPPVTSSRLTVDRSAVGSRE